MPPTEPENNRTLLTAAIVIVVGVIATTLAQPQVLARIPLQNLLKNELHVDRSANAAFFFWAGLAWYFKPFAGIFTDAFPILGSRRKSYILISTTLAVLSWIGLCVTPHEYSKLLWMCIFINAFMVVASTVIGGYMVEIAQAKSASGRLTAVRQFVQQGCSIINGPSAGYLASIAFTFARAAGSLIQDISITSKKSSVRIWRQVSRIGPSPFMVAGKAMKWTMPGWMTWWSGIFIRCYGLET